MHVLRLPHLAALRTVLVAALVVLVALALIAVGAELLPSGDAARIVTEPQPAGTPDLTPAPVLLPDGGATAVSAGR